MIDLHLHSDVSDGSLSPVSLAEQVAVAGLSAAALTDHDTMAGTDSFVARCSALGVRGIAGVEISTAYKPGTMHLLGYFPEKPRHSLEALLVGIREGRHERNQRIDKTLADLGMPLDSVLDVGSKKHGVLGRPHFAAAMVEMGYVRNNREAFMRYLAKGKPAYHERFRPSPKSAIEAIQKAGGVAVLAHPRTLNVEGQALRKCMTLLVNDGLGGVEALYPEHTPQQQVHYAGLARDLNLFVTGGSDFHGASNPDIHIGRGFGNLKVPDSILDHMCLKSGLAFC